MSTIGILVRQEVMLSRQNRQMEIAAKRMAQRLSVHMNIQNTYFLNVVCVI